MLGQMSGLGKLLHCNEKKNRLILFERKKEYGKIGYCNALKCIRREQGEKERLLYGKNCMFLIPT